MSSLSAEAPRESRPPRSQPPRTTVAPEIIGLRLVSEEALELSVLAREFPTLSVRVEEVGVGQERGLVIDDFAWRGSFDSSRFDEVVELARPLAVVTVRGDDSVGVACEVLARYQRLIGRRNQASASPLFDDVLRSHVSLYDREDPLVKGALCHALDTWQWILRLDPDATLPLQLAALFHDVERLESDSQEKLEHRAPERRAGSATSTELGAARDEVRRLLESVGVGEADTVAAVDILAGGEERAAEAGLLDEADALSFLSLESSRYADHFGLSQTRRKVAHTVGRLGARAREKLALVRLRPDIDRLLDA